MAHCQRTMRNRQTQRLRRRTQSSGQTLGVLHRETVFEIGQEGGREGDRVRGKRERATGYRKREYKVRNYAREERTRLGERNREKLCE